MTLCPPLRWAKPCTLFAMTDLLCDSVRVAIEQHVVSFSRETSLSVVLLNEYRYFGDRCV